MQMEYLEQNSSTEETTGLFNDEDNGQRKTAVDIRGYKYCLHCINCTLNSPNRVFPDAYFFCFYKKEWIPVQNALNNNCAGYQRKLCVNCYMIKHGCVVGWRYMNPLKSRGFCLTGYINRGVKRPSNYIIGLRRLPKKHNEIDIENRKKYEEISKLAEQDMCMETTEYESSESQSPECGDGEEEVLSIDPNIPENFWDIT